MRGSGLGISAAESEWMTDHLSLAVPRRNAATSVPTVTHNDLLLSARLIVSGRLVQADVPDVADAPGVVGVVAVAAAVALEPDPDPDPDLDPEPDPEPDVVVAPDAPVAAVCPPQPAIAVKVTPRTTAHAGSKALRLSISPFHWPLAGKRSATGPQTLDAAGPAVVPGTLLVRIHAMWA
jgi:hypothetical protein